MGGRHALSLDSDLTFLLSVLKELWTYSEVWVSLLELHVFVCVSIVAKRTWELMFFFVQFFNMFSMGEVFVSGT